MSNEDVPVWAFVEYCRSWILAMGLPGAVGGAAATVAGCLANSCLDPSPSFSEASVIEVSR